MKIGEECADALEFLLQDGYWYSACVCAKCGCQGGCHAGCLSCDVAARHDAERAFHLVVATDAPVCNQDIFQVPGQQYAVWNAIAFTLGVAEFLAKFLLELDVGFSAGLFGVHVNGVAVAPDLIVEHGAG